MNSLKPRWNFRTWLSNTMLAGLAVLVPLALTLYVLRAIVTGGDQLLAFVPDAVLPREGWRLPGTGLLVALAVTLVAGVLARNLIGRMIGRFAISLIERVPVVAGLYKLFRQISETFLGGGNKGFKAVVLVEWPRRETWTLAFVTGELRGELLAALGSQDREADGDSWLSLFVPTTPNPTSGFYFIARQRDLRPTGLSVEEAFKVIISGGALSPDATEP